MPLYGSNYMLLLYLSAMCSVSFFQVYFVSIWSFFHVFVVCQCCEINMHKYLQS